MKLSIIKKISVFFLVGFFLILVCSSLGFLKFFYFNNSTGDITFGREYFVSPNGSDKNVGTIKEPFATLEHAQYVVRSVKKNEGLPPGGVVIWLRGGIYDLSDTVVFNAEDSGEKGKPIIYSAYANEPVRITGGVKLDNSKFHLVNESSLIWNRLDNAAKGKVYQSNLLDQNISDFGHLTKRGFGSGGKSAIELFFNNDPMQLSRWPDTGENNGKIIDGFAFVSKKISDNTFIYNENRFARWTNAKDVWLHGFWKYLWCDLHIKASKIDANSETLTLSENPPFGLDTGNPFYVENLLEEITVPGEWYLDRGNGMLYFWPPKDINKSELYASMSNSIIELNNTSYIQFKNIIFEMARSTLINIKEGSNNLFTNCMIRNSGADGLRISGESNGLEKCIIYNTANGAVTLSGGNRAKLISAKNYVKNCEIFKFGRWSWSYQSGIYLDGVGNIVAHNKIHNGPHSAILFSGNNHLVEYNDIYDVCKYTGDAGAIYGGKDWSFRGNIFRYNFIHDLKSKFDNDSSKVGGAHGIYLDDCISGITVYGNILYKITGCAVVMGGGRDNLIENNIIANCGNAFTADSRGLERINNRPGDDWNLLEKLTRQGIKYKEHPWLTTYPELAIIPNDWNIVGDKKNSKWLYPEGCIFSRNIGYSNENWKLESNYGGSGSFNKFKEILNNIENSNPLFVDEKNYNMALKKESPAFTIPGFKNIPFDQIGIVE